ncbi:MAG: DUF3147 family protein [Candidatus Zapsychrus exili]|nr:DUF3147 family protein [Candidatus Zapsychrus exili]
MQFTIKLIITISIILFCSIIGKKIPTLSGLIATMPLTGAIVLMWLYFDNPENKTIVQGYTKGAIWGIFPSILFFITAYFCFKKQIPFNITMILSFIVWIIGAFLHQLFLRG